MCGNVHFEVHASGELYTLLFRIIKLMLENIHMHLYSCNASSRKNKNLISIAPNTFGLIYLNDVLFTVLYAQVLDQTISKSTEQRQSSPHATTILLTEKGTTLTI